MFRLLEGGQGRSRHDIRRDGTPMFFTVAAVVVLVVYVLVQL